ncbi:hypothetical protein PB2503_02227 [Parvularcula bermudensis HTCC2503]|uniref:Lipoprotein n=1 Tax=Parvularcula bermudensis (strain ATCC BAA-594 / HTCC2503 / KCTC 12087) TaxID=314260 RepID=E0TC90_PARBH|nr:hypothetical protein [Parvularcula bermudensis]ADM08523.1 hypothetical protein PB2503_02227 [Parvularcula bermudensis HTCC2503]
MLKRASVLVGLAALLSACGSVGDTLDDLSASSERNPGPCPNVFALGDAASKVEFIGPAALENVAWSAEITDVRTSCRYVDDKPIRAEVAIDFAVGRGPAATGAQHDLRYFVAVTRRNTDVIAKEVFTLPVQVRGELATVRLSEEVANILIPRADADTSGTNFEIAVGLVLTREQLLYNRSGQSLRFPEL